MRPCFVVEIVTPKKYVLNGLWFGPKKARRCVVWVHGLGSSLFSKHDIVEKLVDKRTAVLVFNNRGHDKVASVRKTSGAYVRAGAAHEIFAECVDDIQGAVNFARRAGAKDVYVAGHSTGSQKSIYWASKKGRGAKGVILLGPMSDYDGARLEYGKKILARAVAVARSYVKKGKKYELIPPPYWNWPWLADAQRLISLYSGESTEEIFTYWDPSRNPRTLRSVRLPVLVLPAEKEEYTDLPPKRVAAWFGKHLQKGTVKIVPRVTHNYKGGETFVAREIRRFIGA